MRFNWLKFVLGFIGIVATESGSRDYLKQIINLNFRNYGKTERHN